MGATQSFIEQRRDELTFIGLKYHYDTESYDRIHEHGIGPSGKTAMPIDRGASSRNAMNALREAQEEGQAKGFSSQEVKESIQRTSEYDYEEICEMLGRACFEL